VILEGDERCGAGTSTEHGDVSAGHWLVFRVEYSTFELLGRRKCNGDPTHEFTGARL
jgi:hypothetical protein